MPPADGVQVLPGHRPRRGDAGDRPGRARSPAPSRRPSRRARAARRRRASWSPRRSSRRRRAGSSRSTTATRRPSWPWCAQESVRVLRRRGDLVISETRHGFVCANAGVDLSNVADGTAALLPEDSDRSARRIRAGLQNALGRRRRRHRLRHLRAAVAARRHRRGHRVRRRGRRGRPEGHTPTPGSGARRHRGLRRRRARLRGRAGDGQGPRRPGRRRARGARRSGCARPRSAPR